MKYTFSVSIFKWLSSTIGFVILLENLNKFTWENSRVTLGNFETSLSTYLIDMSFTPLFLKKKKILKILNISKS